MKKPNFFIIGAPKCGTTSLASWLAEHPAVYMSPVKEPHHYNNDLNHGLFKDYSKYISLFQDAGGEHLVVGEASVWYLYSETAVLNILNESPDAKFIVMLRNPIEMAPSLHEQMVFSGYETVQDFRKSWVLQDKRRNGENIPTHCPEVKLLLYKDTCNLGEQLQRLYKHVPVENIMTVLLEDIKADPRQAWLDILSFIGLPDDGRYKFSVENPAKIRRSLVLNYINDMYFNFRQRFNLRPLGTGIFTYIDKRNIHERLRPALSSMMHKELIEYFEPDIKLLGKLLNRDLTHWLKQ